MADRTQPRPTKNPLPDADVVPPEDRDEAIRRAAAQLAIRRQLEQEILEEAGEFDEAKRSRMEGELETRGIESGVFDPRNGSWSEKEGREGATVQDIEELRGRQEGRLKAEADEKRQSTNRKAGQAKMQAAGETRRAGLLDEKARIAKEIQEAGSDPEAIRATLRKGSAELMAQAVGDSKPQHFTSVVDYLNNRMVQSAAGDPQGLGEIVAAVEKLNEGSGQAAGQIVAAAKAIAEAFANAS